MDDPTKDVIPRSAVEYCLRKETVSTNPEKYKMHEKFIDYMNDPGISEFGYWMHSNGFNCALTTISVDLKKIPSVTPSAQSECKKGKWLPDNNNYYEERFICFVCGKSYKVDTCMGKPIWDFCPNCGADMRGEQDG